MKGGTKKLRRINNGRMEKHGGSKAGTNGEVRVEKDSRDTKYDWFNGMDLTRLSLVNKRWKVWRRVQQRRRILGEGE